MRLWQVYPECPRCHAVAGTPCLSRQRGREGQPRKNPCQERLRLLGGDRHAQAGELSCGAGGCRNLAVWTLKIFHRGEPYLRPWLSCHLHKDARLRLLREHNKRMSLEFVVEPFQDPTERPAGKTNKINQLGS